MIDIHCHILPGLDDGSQNIADSIAMARLACSSGVSAIVATPHCNHPQSGENYVSQELVRSFMALDAALREQDIPLQLYSGAEILCTPETPELLRRKMLPTIANTRYLLCEFFFDEPLDYMDAMLTSLTAEGVTPVIAHPERYFAVQENRDHIGRWFDQGYIIQMNKGSILGRLGRDACLTAQWMLDNGAVHICASDAHGVTVRTPHMAGLREFFEENYSPRCAEILLYENPWRLIHGEGMA